MTDRRTSLLRYGLGPTSQISSPRWPRTKRERLRAFRATRCSAGNRRDTSRTRRFRPRPALPPREPGRSQAPRSWRPVAARTFQPIRRQCRRSSMTCWPTAQWRLGAARIILSVVDDHVSDNAAMRINSVARLSAIKATSPRRRCYCCDRTHPDGRASRGARRWTAPTAVSAAGATAPAGETFQPLFPQLLQSRRASRTCSGDAVVAFPDLHPADRSRSVRATRNTAASELHSSQYPAVMNARGRAALCLVRCLRRLAGAEKSADEMLLVGLEGSAVPAAGPTLHSDDHRSGLTGFVRAGITALWKWQDVDNAA